MRTTGRGPGQARRRRLLVPCLLLSTAASTAYTPRLIAPSAATANRALVLRFHDALNRQDWALPESLVTLEYRHHVVSDTGFRALTWADVRQGNAAVRAAFPD